MEGNISYILDELDQRVILTQKNVSDLRKFIKTKYQNSPSSNNAVIFADAVKRILHIKMSSINKEYRNEILLTVFMEAVEKQVFSVSAADIFRASLKIDKKDGEFMDQLSEWSAVTLDKPFLRPVIKSHVLQLVNNEKNIFKEAIENAVQNENTANTEEYINLNEIKNVAENEEMVTNELPYISDTDDTIKDTHDFKTQGSEVLDIDNKKEAIGYIQDKIIIFFQKIRSLYLLFNKAAFTAAIGFILILAIIFTIFNIPEKNGNTVAFFVVKPALTANNLMHCINESSDSLVYLTVNSLDSMSQKTDETSENRSEQLRRIISKSNEYTISRADTKIRTGNIISNYKKKLNMRATAYDLSVESCSKTKDHPQYGITFTGTRAEVGRTVAVDPSVIPLKSKLYIVFPENYKELTGIYIAEDTGRLVKDDIIDIFFGEDEPGERIIHAKALKFGKQNVVVYILE